MLAGLACAKDGIDAFVGQIMERFAKTGVILGPLELKNIEIPLCFVKMPGINPQSVCPLGFDAEAIVLQ